MRCTATCASLLFSMSITMYLAGSVLGQESGWRDLFDGESLDGWIQKNGTATYRVEDGTVVGTSSEGSPNSFLCTDEDYGDFELEFDVKVDDPLNSGVQIRSTTAEVTPAEEDAGKFGRVNGPQVEIAAGGAEGSVSGFVYGEATGRDWLTPDARRKPHEHFHNGQWNHYRIVAQGPRIQTWINDAPIEDLTDEPIYQTHPQGFIALQVHAVPAGAGPYEVAWKNIRLKEFRPE